MGFSHALSGLNAASKNLDVVGNNISNSSTVGFKGSRTEFNEMVASAMGASSGTNTGIGVSVAAVSQQFSQGNITPTNSGLDMAINGDGFFVVNTATGIAYTRNGAFQLNKDGELVTVNGDVVQGYKLNLETGERETVTPSDLEFPTGAPIPAKQTGSVSAIINLDARVDQNATPAPARATYGTSLEVYDEQGMATPLSMYFEKTAANTWTVYDSLDTNAEPIGQLTFSSTGKLQAVAGYAGLGTDVNGLNPGDTGYTNTPTFGAATGTTLSAMVQSTNPNAPNPGAWNVDIDLSNVTQLGSSFSVAKLTQDGYASGELTNVSVSSDGTLMATYSNGITRPEAQIALARFTNTQGLQAAGNNNWVATFDAGPPIVGTAGTGSFGAIQGNALEDSNVDLTAELVNMMTAQRAYQANAQTIKTQDQIFSTLVNLR